jgi:hypothetical protein
MFPVALAANLASVEPGTLRAWFQRGDFRMWEEDEPAAKNGMARSLTFRTILHISLTARLWSKGVKVADAYAAAMKWVHFDLCGEVYPGEDWTLLIHFSGPDAQVARATFSGEKLQIDLRDIMAFGSPGPTIIFLNPLLHTARDVCSQYLADHQ